MAELALVGYANDSRFVDFFLQPNVLTFPFERVSIVIPHYNRVTHLDKCLCKLESQTYPTDKMEIIIADDGSSQDVGVVVEKYSSRFYSCTLVSQDDLGFRLSGVRNLGIQKATSKYIILLDCDVIPTPTLVENHLRVLQVSKNVVSIGLRKDNACLEDTEDLSISKSDLDWRYQKTLKEERNFYALSKQPYIFSSGGNIAFHKDVAVAHPFDESFVFWGGEDNEWGYRLTLAGYFFYLNLNASAWHLEKPTYSNESYEVGKAEYLRKCPGVSYENAVRKDLSKPYISFWVTSFNKKEYILESLESIKGCRFSHEIVVIENGSSDGSVELLKSYALNNPNVQLYCESTEGPHFAYERALQVSKGELLIQLDADDVLVLDELENILISHFYASFGLMYGLTQACGLDLNPLENSVWIPKEKDSRHFNAFTGMSIRNPRIIHKRELSRICARDFYTCAVDYELYSKFMLITKPYMHEKVTYKYRVDTHNSITKHHREKQKENSKKIVCKNTSLLTKSDISETFYYVDHLGLNREMITKEKIDQMVEYCKLNSL